MNLLKLATLVFVFCAAAWFGPGSQDAQAAAPAAAPAPTPIAFTECGCIPELDIRTSTCACGVTVMTSNIINGDCFTTPNCTWGGLQCSVTFTATFSGGGACTGSPSVTRSANCTSAASGTGIPCPIGGQVVVGVLCPTC